MSLTKKFNNPDNFFNKIFHSPDGCWYWLGAVYKNGYGQIGFNREHQSAHRFSYKFFKGDIPGRLCVLHSCDNRLCVNPNHLRLGTHKDNTQDMISKGRRGDTGTGSNHKDSKLKEKHIPLIRNMSLNGDSLTSIASKYGVKWQTIQAIINRRTWKHV